MKPAILAIHRKNTVRFIAENPFEVALTPRSKQEQPTGGWKWEVGDQRDVQTLRIIELGMLATPPVIQLTNGKQTTVEYWLLGPHDAEMAKGDFWIDGEGHVWEVGHVIRDNGYEVRGLVAERGEQ